MIESQISYRFAYKIIAIFVFINFFIASFCTTERPYPQEKTYCFNTEDFIVSNSILLFSCGILFLIRLQKKRKITIGNNKIIVQSILSKKAVEFSFSEIVGLTWGFTQKSYGGPALGGPRMRSTIQNINVQFSDESELPISNYEYQNYEELMDFFYNYCIDNNIIENVAEKRKKRRNSR